MPQHYNVNAIAGQSSITTYTVSAAAANPTPIQVIGKTVFQFDGIINMMLNRNDPATQQFALVCIVGVGSGLYEIDFGTFGRTVYVFSGAPLQLSVWTNTNGVN